MKKASEKLPASMWALRQENAGGSLELQEIPCPVPGPGEVVVRMSHAPINPSDLSMLRGGYLQRPYPYTPGLEGAGTVAAAGSGLLPAMRMGKKVACSPPHGSDGTWAEYMRTSATNVVPLPSGLERRAGSMLLVNPMSALALFEMVAANGHSAFVNTAAASALGRMLQRLAASSGTPLINIVRRREQVELLKGEGATHVLDSSEEGFLEALGRSCKELDATLLLDAISGPESRDLFAALPPGSAMVSYARLSVEQLQIDPRDLITEDKHIEGFQLGNWLSGKSMLYKLRFIGRVKARMSKELSSEISREFPFREAPAAIEHYRSNMSEGKVLLNFD